MASRQIWKADLIVTIKTFDCSFIRKNYRNESTKEFSGLYHQQANNKLKINSYKRHNRSNSPNRSIRKLLKQSNTN